MSGADAFAAALEKPRLGPGMVDAGVEGRIAESRAARKADDFVDVTLDDIDEDADGLNPRFLDNPETEDLYESLLASGLQQPFTLTRAPGARKYGLFAGGRTRVRLLRRAYDETGEERFFRHRLPFRPWSDKVRIFAGHVTENNLRGGLSFIENAVAAGRLTALIEEDDPGFSARSFRDRAARFKEHGWPVQHSLLSYYEYTVEAIYPHLPNALRSGLGRTAIVRIQRAERSLGHLLETRDASAAEGWRERVGEVLVAHDGPASPDASGESAFDVARVEEALRAEAAKRLGVPVSELSPKRASASTVESDTSSDTVLAGSTAGQPAGSAAGSRADEREAEREAERAGGARAEGRGRAGGREPNGGATTFAPTALDVDALLAQLSRLRQAAQEIALPLAVDYGLVKPAQCFFTPRPSDQVLGFCVSAPSDASGFHEGEEGALAVLVHALLYAVYWTAVGVDRRAGLAPDDVLSSDLSPAAVASAVAYEGHTPLDLWLAVADLRARAASGEATVQEQDIVDSSQRLHALLEEYAITAHALARAGGAPARTSSDADG